MKIPEITWKIEKKAFLTVCPNNTFKVSFLGHFLSTYIDQPQLDEVVFSIIYFDLYK